MMTSSLAGPEVKACSGPFSSACQQAMGKASDALGDYNIYNIYDTCGDGNMSAAASSAASPMATMIEHIERLEAQHAGGVGGGPPFPYPCGTGNAVDVWMNNPDVRKAINVPPQSFYGGKPWPNRGMQYSTYTHASIDLWLVQHRITPPPFRM